MPSKAQNHLEVNGILVQYVNGFILDDVSDKLKTLILIFKFRVLTWQGCWNPLFMSLENLRNFEYQRRWESCKSLVTLWIVENIICYKYVHVKAPRYMRVGSSALEAIANTHYFFGGCWCRKSGVNWEGSRFVLVVHYSFSGLLPHYSSGTITK